VVASASQRSSSAVGSSASFFSGWRSIPGTIPTSQLDWLISMTAISVLS
jgi:hypothetical protein